MREYIGGPIKRSTQEWWSRLARMAGQANQPLAVTLRSNGEFIGNCGYLIGTNVSNNPEFYCLLRRKFWHKSFASELGEQMVAVAFEHLGASRVTGIIHPDNTASMNLVGKLEFVFSGRYNRATTRFNDDHPIYEIKREAYNKSFKYVPGLRPSTGPKKAAPFWAA